MSGDFELAYSPEEAKAYLAFEEKQHQADVLIENALDDIGIEGNAVLDYGCGLGRMEPLLIKLGASKVVGCDPSTDMIEEAERRRITGKLRIPNKICFDILKSFPLPYASEAFDGVLLRFVFHYIRDTAPVLNELARVLHPGGWMVAIFSDVSVKSGSERLVNTTLPLHFLADLTLTTLVKQGTEIVANARSAGFEIVSYSNPTDATVVSIDPSYPYADEIERFGTGFLVAKRNDSIGFSQRLRLPSSSSH